MNSKFATRLQDSPVLRFGAQDDEDFFVRHKDRHHRVRPGLFGEMPSGISEAGRTVYLVIRKHEQTYYKVIMTTNAGAPAPQNTEWNAAYLFQHFAPAKLLKALAAAERTEKKMKDRTVPAAKMRSTGLLN